MVARHLAKANLTTPLCIRVIHSGVVIFLLCCSLFYITFEHKSNLGGRRGTPLPHTKGVALSIVC